MNATGKSFWVLKWLTVILTLGAALTGALPPVGCVQESSGQRPPGNVLSAADEGSQVTLDELVREACENNPAIQGAAYSAAAKRSLVLPAQTLPDPVLGFQTMGDLIPPTLQEGDPSSARTFSVEQEVPFPGKLSLKGQIAGMEAEAEKWSSEQVRRQVVADVKAAYYDLYLLDKSAEVIKKDQELLNSFVQIAEAKYRVGQGIQQDVLKANVEISKLIDRLLVLEQRRGSVEALLISLLYRPPGAPVGRPADFKKVSLSHSLEELSHMAQANNALLIRQEREIDRNRTAVDLSRKEFYPDFTLGFTYYNRTVPEMYGLMLNVKVPLYFWRKQRLELESATAELRGSRKQRENILAELFAKLRDSYLAATTSDKLITLYRENLIPQAEMSLQSALANYQVGNVDFLTLIDTLVTLLEYELKYYEVFTDYHKALARLELYVGTEVTR